MAFYARNRRKKQGLAFIQAVRAAMPAVSKTSPVSSNMPLARDEWESPSFEAFRADARIG
jgi:hypothetical protein